MKKTFLLLIMMVAAVTMNAQVFTEYFETATSGSNLEDYNDWYMSFKSSEQGGVSPVIVEETLFYDGYIGSDIGKAAFLDSLVGKDSDTQRISTKVVEIGGDTLRPIVGETMYAAFMVSVLPNSKTSFRDFFTWEASSGSSFQRGRVFAKVSNDNTDLQFAVSKNSSSSGVYVESDVIAGGVEVYHLLVLAYEVIDGDANDVIKLYINPDPTLTQAEQTVVLESTDTQSDYTAGSSKIKINLRQRGVGALVGGIRVGTNWKDVLLGAEVVTQTVTFNVDMSAQAVNTGDHFMFANDVVYVTGSYDGVESWGWDEPGTGASILLTDDNADNIWTGSLEYPANSSFEYKYFLNTGWDNGDGFTNDHQDNNRTADVAAEDLVLNDTWGAIVHTSGVAVSEFDAKGFSLYPNPVSDGVLFVKLSETNKANSIEVYNMLGALVHSELVDNRSNLSINTDGLFSKGVYILKVNNTSGSHIEQFIVQ